MEIIAKWEIAKENFYAEKKVYKIRDVNVDNIFISKLVKTKTNSKYLIGYLDKTIRSLVLKCLKWVDMSRHLQWKKETIT